MPIQRQRGSAVGELADPGPMDRRASESLGSAGDLLELVASSYAADPKFMDSIQGQGCALRDNLWWRDDCLVIPNVPALKQTLLSELHDSPYAGHVGADRTAQNVRIAKLWWPHYRSEVTAYVRTCGSCQRAKALTRSNAGLLQPLPVPEQRWETVTADFITDLPVTGDGNDAVLVVVDKLSKMCHLLPTKKSLTAEGCARLFFYGVFKYHGFPGNIVSDRDKLFTSKFWETFHGLVGTQLSRSSAFHPQTDGQTERLNRTLEDMLRHYVSPLHEDWDRWLPCAEFAINNSVLQATGTTPFFLNYGQHPRTPLHLNITRQLQKFGTLSRVPRAVDFAQAMQDHVQQARKHLLAARDRMSCYVNAGRSAVSFSVGQAVLLNTKNLSFKGPGTRKFHPRWIGPFTVTRCIGSSAYELDLLPSMRIHPVFHGSLLKPYRQDGRRQPPPPPIQLDGEDEYEVDRILDHRYVGKRKRLQFLVRWTGYGPEHDTWEPDGNLENSPDVVQAYWDFLGGDPGRRHSRRQQ